ncbi:MAG: tRNA (adenosine(37)-N6)-dimethylallyltransferase MiaA [Propionibacteriaceae bacterium]|jgi:tRNA dimethylallyltransferase|nr:tRNA (adenosine(37)-N6)-dimethylallyltransferase MiaA [Propionibacteriaceae bacterium]
MVNVSQLPVIVLNGPTASGKTELAVALAHALGQPAEVVNADSMLVYRGMDIGTAKPGLAERGGVPHHLIDIMDITDEASVAEFQALARAAIADCRARGAIPVLVGGSALYVRAILDEFEFPSTDPAVRAKWEQRLAEVGSERLHAELAALSPEAAAGILPGNGRRIVRALEVVELTGSFRSTIPAGKYAVENVIQFGLELPRPEMDARIAIRVERMWQRGFPAEVEALLGRGLRQGRTASRAIGYRQLIAYFDGELTLPEAKEQTAIRTRQFSRKQLSWFRRDPRIVWVAAGPAAVTELVALIGKLSPATSSLGGHQVIGRRDG